MPMPLSGAARPSFSVSNIEAESPPGPHALQHFADRAHGFDQAPEGAEQAEKDQQAGQVARQVARFVETVGDRVENAAHHLRRHRHPAGALAQDGSHRRQEDRRAVDRDAGIGEPEPVHPRDFAEQPDHLAEGENDADRQHAEDQAVEAGIGEERRPGSACTE